MTPPGPDPPGPDPPGPTPTTHTVQYQFNSSNDLTITTWMQTEETWGSGSISGSSTSQNTGTFSFSCPEGSNYIFVGVGTKSQSRALVTIKKGGSTGTTLSTTFVTNGTVNAFKAPITIDADTNIWISAQSM